MNKRTLTIVLAVVLIGAFFLPYLSAGGMEISGFEIVKAKGGDWKKYIPALFPLAGLLLLIGAANNGNYPLERNFLAWLPLLAAIFLLVIDPLLLDKTDMGAMLKMIGYGLWITVAASLVLAFYNPRGN